ncbi:MAG TPA: NUDIX domain-containing protein [bacterium]|nr:NUDIX domain-containing protein [bacterium]
MEIILRDTDVPGAGTLPIDWGDGQAPAPFRETVRAVVYDPEMDTFLILHVSRYDRYEVAGGGREDGEAITETLSRELAEETGVTEYEIIAELGSVREYFERAGIERLHHAFLVRPTIALSEPEFTDKEIFEGTSRQWISANEILDVMDTMPGQDYASRFVWYRSRLLVERSLRLLKSRSS